MSKTSKPLLALPTPKTITAPSAQIVQAGPLVPPHLRLRIMSASEWEDLVHEWADSLKSQYRDTGHYGGAGDMGCDIVARLHKGKTPDAWHNFQCKHYDHALTPSDVWIELGKVCYYTAAGEFTPPEEYYFVAPRGVGTSLAKLLGTPGDLRAGLIAHWAKHCEEGITDTKRVPLKGALRKHVDAFDFSIFRELSTRRLIEEHSQTRWHVARFGGGLPPRPPVAAPPTFPAPSETRYVRQLLDAYADCLGVPIANPTTLQNHPDHGAHFDRSRVQFYCAESLRTFSRETLPEGCFADLQDEICDAVLDTTSLPHVHGYACVVQTIAAARSIDLSSHPLNICLRPRDRAGICHQLANEDRLMWVRP